MRLVWSKAWLFAAGFFLFLTACHRRPEVSGADRAATEPRPVEMAVAVRRALDRTLSVLGSFAAKQEAQLSAKVAGRLQSISVDLGSPVKAGEVLAQIESRDYELNLLQAEAALAQARALVGLPISGEDDSIDLEQTASVREARAVFNRARTNRERAERLLGDGILSSAEFEGVEADYQVALNRYEVSLEEARQRHATVAQRRVGVDIAQQQLSDATMVAPFDGMIQRRHVNPGQYLKSGDPVVTLVQIDPLRLQLEVPEKEAARMRLGEEVRFRVTGETGGRTARVDRITPALDRVSRALLIEADVSNPGTLHAGSFAETEIVLEQDAEAVTVPAAALRTFAGIEKVFVVEKDVAAERDVVTGQRTADWVEIVSGVREGERVVLDPGSLRQGDPVTRRSGD